MGDSLDRRRSEPPLNVPLRRRQLPSSEPPTIWPTPTHGEAAAPASPSCKDDLEGSDPARQV